MIRFIFWPILFGFIGAHRDSISNDYSGSILNHIGVVFGLSLGILFAIWMSKRNAPKIVTPRKIVLTRWGFAFVGGLSLSIWWIYISPEGENFWLPGVFGFYIGFVAGGLAALAKEHLFRSKPNYIGEQ